MVLPPRTSPRALSLLAALLLLGSCSRRAAEPDPVEAAAPTAAATTSTARQDAGSGSRGTTFKFEPLPPDAPFEGGLTIQVITPEMGNDTGPALYYFTLKGKKARWDLFGEGGRGGPTGYRIYDGAEHKFYSVFTTRETIFVVNEGDVLPDAGAAHAWKFTKIKVEPKGAVKNYTCDRKETHDDQFLYEACLSSDFPPFPMQVLSGALASTVPFNATLQDQGLFPLAVAVRRPPPKDGPAIKALVSTMTVLEVQRGRVPPTAFDLPPFRRLPATTLDARPQGSEVLH